MINDGFGAEFVLEEDDCDIVDTEDRTTCVDETFV